ncbi:MAG: NAD(P)-dependent oxidoreductase [Terriglobales bacterium]
MKLLITGGSGFIGRNLVEHLAGHFDVAAPSSAELNLLDAAAVRQYLCTHRFDVIVHAATARSNRRLGAPPDMLDRNCRMFFNLARNDGLFGKMIHFGSGAEYDRTGLPPRVREDYFDTSVPTDPYGFSKYICAKYIERAERIVELRLFAVFGKYEDYTVRFISNACARVVAGLPIVIRQDVRFDYLYVNDLAGVTSWFVENDTRYKAYNICAGSSYKMTELARMVAEISDRNPRIIVRNESLGTEYTADISRWLTEIGTFDFCPMRQAVAELYAWYAAHPEMIKTELLRFDE